MTFDLSWMPGEIAVPVGESVDVPLPSYAGGGYEWSVTCLARQEVADLAISQGGKPQSASPSPQPGTAEPPESFLTDEWLTVTGLAAGEALWQLKLARSFAPESPAAEHQLRVTVRPVSEYG